MPGSDFCPKNIFIFAINNDLSEKELDSDEYDDLVNLSSESDEEESTVYQ